MTEENAEMYKWIVLRIRELTEQHPQKKELFEGYLRAQQDEIDVLESEVTGVTWLLKKS